MEEASTRSRLPGARVRATALASRGVRAREEVAGVVLEALEAVSRRPVGPQSDLDDVLLGKRGLGLDSIDVVEVLSLCEDRYGKPIGPLLERGVPITFGSVVDHFAAR